MPDFWHIVTFLALSLSTFSEWCLHPTQVRHVPQAARSVVFFQGTGCVGTTALHFAWFFLMGQNMAKWYNIEPVCISLQWLTLRHFIHCLLVTANLTALNQPVATLPCRLSQDISDFASTYAPYSYSLEGLLWVLCSKVPEDNVILVLS